MKQFRLERSWVYAGLDCAVVLANDGYRTGYVRVPEGHPWHGKVLDDVVADPAERMQDILGPVDHLGLPMLLQLLLGDEESFTAHLSTLGGQVICHGGLTWAGPPRNGVLPEGWWLGFDCGHCNDVPDLAAAWGGPLARSHAEFVVRMVRDYPDVGWIYWPADAVANEVTKVADQVRVAVGSDAASASTLEA